MLFRVLKNIMTSAKSSEIQRDHVVKIDEVNRLVRTRHGWFLANAYDRFLGHALLKYGECRELEHQLFAMLLSHGDHIIEVGSNIGVHTVGLAQVVGDTGKVIAVEPQPHLYRVLNANLALNNIQNVTTHLCGCGMHREFWTLPASDYTKPVAHNSGSVSLSPSGPGIEVQVVPLEELVPDSYAPRLIKVDVEGMELDVLHGGHGLIQRHRPLLYVENDRIDKRRTLIQWILDLDYRAWWHLPPLYNPDNYFGVSDNEYPNVVSVNMLCIPREQNYFATDGLIEIIAADADFSHIPCS